MSLDKTPMTRAILERCEKDEVFKQEILDFLENVEEALAIIRTRLGE